MTIDLYYMPESPPCRAVELVADQLKIKLNKKYLNLAKGEHLNPEFVKINPFHCVPTIVDGDLVLWESRAIVNYLVNKYGGDDNTLYPKDPIKRAKVDLMLYFDMGTLFKAQSELLRPQLVGNNDLDKDKEMKFKEALKYLDGVTSTHKFSTGDDVTVADASIVCSLTFSEACDYDISEFKSVTAYIERVKKSFPTYDAVNAKAIEGFRAYVKSKQKAH